jgi:hypothetical protein
LPAKDDVLIVLPGAAPDAAAYPRNLVPGSTHMPTRIGWQPAAVEKLPDGYEPNPRPLRIIGWVPESLELTAGILRL